MLNKVYINKYYRKDTQFEDIDQDPEKETWNSSFPVKVKDFSNVLLHTPGNPVIPEELTPFILKLYPNGKSIKQQNYISVVFNIRDFYLVRRSEYFELVCNLSVIDVSQKYRFPQSCVFVFNRDPAMKVCDISHLAFDKFLKRSTILNDSADLLPGDCFTLQIDVIIRAKYFQLHPNDIVNITNCYTPIFLNGEVKKFSLYLNSHLAKCLVKVSAFFRNMLQIPMDEKKNQLMDFPVEDADSFITACAILMGYKEIIARSVIDICDIYEVAHLYDITPVIESCRNLLTTILRTETYQYTVKHITENKEMLLKFVEFYEEKQLKENIESFLKFNSEESEQERSSKKKLLSNLGTEWKLELHPFEMYEYFLFTRYKDEVEKKPEVDFYDFYQ